jgi:hypothetical protein
MNQFIYFFILVFGIKKHSFYTRENYRNHGIIAAKNHCYLKDFYDMVSK